MLAELVQNPGRIGFHLCGAYQRNRSRRYDLIDEAEQPEPEYVELIKAANEKISQRMDEAYGILFYLLEQQFDEVLIPFLSDDLTKVYRFLRDNPYEQSTKYHFDHH